MTRINKQFKLKTLGKKIYRDLSQDMFRYIEFKDGFAYVTNGMFILKSNIDNVFDNITTKEKDIIDGKKMLISDFEALRKSESIEMGVKEIIGKDKNGYVGLLLDIKPSASIHEKYDSWMNGKRDKASYMWLSLECTSIISSIVDDQNFNVDIICKEFCHATSVWGGHEFILKNKKSK